MGFKFKVNESTTLVEARKFLEELKNSNVKELSLNDVRRLLRFLDVEDLPSKGGSALRFRHGVLCGHPHFLDGIFAIHIKHKGGDQQIISKIDFKAYLYPALKQIIELLEKN